MTKDDDHDRGLFQDLSALADFAARRRAVLKWGLGLSALPLLGCASDAGNQAAIAGAGNAGAASSDGSCSKIPTETGGPYPGDGTNGANALTLTGIVRSDIRSSLAGASGVADGVPLTVTLTLLDSGNRCQPLAGYAVYLWHCDRDGNYSMYSAAASNENYLRGVQVTDENGQVAFATIYPGCYSGRWPHIHFEVYPSLEVASSGKNAVATSQLALPQDVCAEVYAASGYQASVTTFAQVSLASDNVFSDGAELETPVVSGDVDAGYSAKLNMTV